MKINLKNLKIVKDKYANGALYLGLQDNKTGEMYCDITTNLIGYTDSFTIAVEDGLAVKLSPVIDNLLKEYEGFKMLSVSSGFNNYTLYTLLNIY